MNSRILLRFPWLFVVRYIVASVLAADVFVGLLVIGFVEIPNKRLLQN